MHVVVKYLHCNSREKDRLLNDQYPAILQFFFYTNALRSSFLMPDFQMPCRYASLQTSWVNTVVNHRKQNYCLKKNYIVKLCTRMEELYNIAQTAKLCVEHNGSWYHHSSSCGVAGWSPWPASLSVIFRQNLNKSVGPDSCTYVILCSEVFWSDRVTIEM